MYTRSRPDATAEIGRKCLKGGDFGRKKSGRRGWLGSIMALLFLFNDTLSIFHQDGAEDKDQ